MLFVRRVQGLSDEGFLVMGRFQDPESEDGYILTLQLIREADNGISSADEPTLEIVQTYLLLSIAQYGIGNGKYSSRSLGSPSKCALD
jgi:hypothetical protein